MKKLLLLLMVVLAATLPGRALDPVDGNPAGSKPGSKTYQFIWGSSSNNTYNLPTDASDTWSLDLADTGIIMTNVKGISMGAMMNGRYVGLYSSAGGDSFTLTAPSGYTITSVVMSMHNNEGNLKTDGTFGFANTSNWTISNLDSEVVTVTATQEWIAKAMWVTISPSGNMKIATLEWNQEGYGESAVNLNWNDYVDLPAVKAMDGDEDVTDQGTVEYSVTGNLQIVEIGGVKKLTGLYPLRSTYGHDYVSADLRATWSSDDYDDVSFVTQTIKVIVPSDGEKVNVNLAWTSDDNQWTFKEGENLVIPDVTATLDDGTDVTDLGTLSFSSKDGKFYVEDSQLVANVFEFGEADLEVKWTPKSNWIVPITGEYYPSTLDCQTYYNNATMDQKVTIEQTLKDLTIWYKNADNQVVSDLDLTLTEGIKNVPMNMPVVKGYNDATLTAPANGTFTFRAVGIDDEYNESEENSPVTVNYDAKNGTITLSTTETAKADDFGMVYVTFTPTGVSADRYEVAESAFTVTIAEKTSSNAPEVTFTPDLGNNGMEEGENANLFINSVKVAITEYEEGGSTWYTLDGSVPEFEGAHSYKFEPKTVAPEEGDENAEATVDNTITFTQADAINEGNFMDSNLAQLVFKVASFNAAGEKPSETQTFTAFFVQPTGFTATGESGPEPVEPGNAVQFADMFDAHLGVSNPAALGNVHPTLKYRFLAEGDVADEVPVYTSYDLTAIDLSNTKVGDFTVEAWYAIEGREQVNGTGTISQEVSIAAPAKPNAPVLSISLGEDEEVAEVEDGQKLNMTFDGTNADKYTIKYTIDGTEPTAENGIAGNEYTFAYNKEDLTKNAFTVKAVAYVTNYPEAISDVVELPVKVLLFDQVLGITFSNQDWTALTADNFNDFVVATPAIVTNAEYEGIVTVYGDELGLQAPLEASATFTLDKELEASRIVVYALQNNTTNDTPFTVNGQDFTIEKGVEGYNYYTLDLTGDDATFDKITIVSPEGFIKVKSIQVYTRGDVAGVPTITVDDETNMVTITPGENAVSTYYALFTNGRPTDEDLESAIWVKYEDPIAVNGGGYVYAYSANATGLKSAYANATVTVAINAVLKLDDKYYDTEDAECSKYATNADINVYVEDADGNKINLPVADATLVLTDKDGNAINNEEGDVWSATWNAGTFYVKVFKAGQYKVNASWEQEYTYRAGSAELESFLNIYVPVTENTNVEEVTTKDGETVNFIEAPEAQDGTTMVELAQEDGVELWYTQLPTESAETPAPEQMPMFAAEEVSFDNVNSNPGLDSNYTWTKADNGQIQLNGQNGSFMAATVVNGVASPATVYYFGTQDYKTELETGIPTGINSVNADEEGVEYFDINGYRVRGNELKAGIYVRVLNGKSTKVVVK